MHNFFDSDIYLFSVIWYWYIYIFIVIYLFYNYIILLICIIYFSIYIIISRNLYASINKIIIFLFIIFFETIWVYMINYIRLSILRDIYIFILKRLLNTVLYKSLRGNRVVIALIFFVVTTQEIICVINFSRVSSMILLLESKFIHRTRRSSEKLLQRGVHHFRLKKRNIQLSLINYKPVNYKLEIIVC